MIFVATILDILIWMELIFGVLKKTWGYDVPNGFPIFYFCFLEKNYY